MSASVGPGTSPGRRAMILSAAAAVARSASCLYSGCGCRARKAPCAAATKCAQVASGSADGFYYDDDVVSTHGLLPASSLLLHRQGAPGAVGNLPLHSAPGPS